MSSTEQMQVLIGVGKSAAYYGGMAAGLYFGLKYGLKETNTALKNHIEDDQKNFAQVTADNKRISGKLDTTIGLLQDHAIALAEHDERATGMRERQERIEGKISSIDDKLTEFRIAVAKKM